MTTMVSVRLPDEINQRLTLLAEQTGRTKTYYIKEAVLKHLQDLEDVYMADKELEDIRAGRSKTVSLEDMMGQYGLES